MLENLPGCKHGDVVALWSGTLDETTFGLRVAGGHPRGLGKALVHMLC